MTRRDGYFLKSWSNAARASFELRGAVGAGDGAVPEDVVSRATVTRGENNSHGFA
jgi:hypothetical protein